MPQEPEHKGRFVKNVVVRPALEVDCSTWDADTAGEKWTTGRFVVSKVVRPAVEVDCSDWPQSPPVLELTLQPDPAVDPVQLAVGLFEVLNAVSHLDRALGGTGLTKVSSRQSNGSVTLVLAAEQQTGAADRLRQICEQLNCATPTTVAIPLPTVVKTITARVAG